MSWFRGGRACCRWRIRARQPGADFAMRVVAVPWSRATSGASEWSFLVLVRVGLRPCSSRRRCNASIGKLGIGFDGSCRPGKFLRSWLCKRIVCFFEWIARKSINGVYFYKVCLRFPEISKLHFFFFFLELFEPQKTMLWFVKTFSSHFKRSTLKKPAQPSQAKMP